MVQDIRSKKASYSNSPHGCVPKKTENMLPCQKKNLYINAHSSITHNSQKMETTQIKHGISIQHNVIQHSAIKRNVIVIRATAWMNLANMLNERSQVQKNKQHL